ncbi:TMEM175 family protein [Gryllotalpicola protaetiae]|uniref:DUF1211 domain-containing protein n=1 Tax=Gryllotalpicola protaetiae TaxID=2419771 RepID=A0A387BEE0_9MICO|nr:TMEM175 family protein [Gryllotalpicola protaetiae]AYG02335.1 DUF1211 domain-containing protein [Gryllotalpicola protaetiae]
MKGRPGRADEAESTRTHGGRDRLISPRRLEAFTDGVFAIAATLLVLDVSVEALGSGIRTNHELWTALGKLSPQLIGFGISFLILGALWVGHARQFEHVRVVDTVVLTLNTVRLLGVVVVPFTTSLNSEYGHLLAGRLLLPANFFFVVLLSAAQSFYLTARPELFLRGVTAEQLVQERLNSLGALVAAA